MKSSWLATGCMTLLLSAACYGQLPKDRTDWQTEPWTADDSGMTKLRKSLESQDRADVVTRRKWFYKTIIDGGKSASDLYGFLISAIISTRGDYETYQSFIAETDLDQVIAGFKNSGLNNSREMVRAKFLFLVTFDFPHHSYVDLAKRLFRSDKSDRSVQVAAIRILQPQHWKEDRSFGTQLIQAIDAVNPENASPPFYTGVYFYLCYLGSNAESDKLEARRRLTQAKSLTRSTAWQKNIDNLLRLVS